jgi:hypothetical protein
LPPFRSLLANRDKTLVNGFAGVRGLAEPQADAVDVQQDFGPLLELAHEFPVVLSGIGTTAMGHVWNQGVLLV